MPGRGPAPQLNATGRARGVVVRHEVPAGEPWPTPDGVWHPKAVRWWVRMTSSPSAALWDSPADVDQLERGLAHAHSFWSLFDSGATRELAAVETILMRVETVLWLNRTERARQGIKVDTGDRAKPSAVSPSRERLRAIDAVG